MAIVMPAPVATCQADGAPIILRFHCSANAGSFGFAGVAWAGAKKPSDAPTTSSSAPQRVTFDRTRPFSTIWTPARASGPVSGYRRRRTVTTLP